MPKMPVARFPNGELRTICSDPNASSAIKARTRKAIPAYIVEVKNEEEFQNLQRHLGKVN